MSVLNQSGEEQVECPLCMEPLEVDDLHFYPCTCGYQICRFCWNRIREGENGLCPACRKAYPENPADFTPLSQEQVAAIKTEKKAREQKRRNKTLESRRALANVRVVQNNLVFVVGLPVRLADPETLKRQEYFGKYGKIHKVVINQSTTYAGSQGPSASAYVTYVSPADALRAIQGVNNVTLDGRVLKGSLGTTKYCANFMKNQPCPKPDCMYLHELGDPKASFTKEEMHAGLHQVYERKLHSLLNSSQQQPNTSGNTGTSAEKGSSKDGNQSSFIPTTVITSSHINIVNSSKSKKDSSSGGSNSSNSNGNKEAWPSLGSSPPTADSPTRKQTSPKPQQNAKSQENGTPENNSPTNQAQVKINKDNHTDHNKRCNRDNGSANNNHSSKKSKNTDSQKGKKHTNNTNDTDTIANHHDEVSSTEETETQQQKYLTNELDELESDRHSLLENHDLLNNSDHSLLEDDSTHNLLDVKSDVMLMQRHKEIFTGLVDSSHLIHMKSTPLVNGFGIMDRDSYLSNDRQISQGMIDKDALLRERSRSEMVMRQNEIMAKHYMPSSSVSLESAGELLGANYQTNILPPFGMRVDSSMAANSLVPNALSADTMGANTLTVNTMGVNTMTLAPHNVGRSYMHNLHLLQNQHQQQMQQNSLVNGFNASQAAAQPEGRYLAENMDKFFTDFNKAQQMRLLVSDKHRDVRPRMVSAERLEMEHKHRLSGNRPELGGAAGDDDLDFDPFNETQKALAEMMETEMMQNSLTTSELERVRRPQQLPPPGFSHMNAFGIGVPRAHSHLQGFNSQNAMYTDWTQMDPAIMSTSVNKGAVQQQNSLNQQQQELFARFNQLNVSQPNGVSKILQNGQQLSMSSQHVLNGQTQWANQAQKLGWNLPSYNNVPLPPGFAPSKPPQHSECIDAK